MKRTYRVGGAHSVLGREPGAVFTAEIPPDQEARLIQRGSLTRVQKDAPKKEKK